MEESKPDKQPHRLILNFLGVLILAAGILAILLLSSREKTQVEILEAGQEEDEVVVDLQGAVEKPGVYKLRSDSRVNDLLVAAGGLKSDADREWFAKNINLAQKLSDGIKIYVPFQGEVEKEQSYSGQVAGLASEKLGEKININLAVSAELELLPGIGPATAQKIIDYRQENGPFASAEEIMKVPGIGEKTFEKIKNKITA